MTVVVVLGVRLPGSVAVGLGFSLISMFAFGFLLRTGVLRPSYAQLSFLINAAVLRFTPNSLLVFLPRRTPH